MMLSVSCFLFSFPQVSSSYEEWQPHINCLAKEETSVLWAWQEAGLEFIGSWEISVTSLRSFPWGQLSPPEIRPEGINAFPPDNGKERRKWGLRINPFTGADGASVSHLRPATQQANEWGVLGELTLALIAVRMVVVLSNSRKVASLGYQSWQVPGGTSLSAFLFCFMFYYLPFEVFHLVITVSLKIDQQTAAFSINLAPQSTFVNKALLQKSHPHSHMHCRWLLSHYNGRVEWLQ